MIRMLVNNKKGFTIIEIIAVVAILASLVTVAVPAVINVSTKIQDSMYCSKVNDVIAAAKLYERDYKDEIDSGYLKISVYDLVKYNYLRKEDTACDTNRTEANLDSNCVKDPRNNNSMDNLPILLAQNGKKSGAKLLDSDSAKICKDSNISEDDDIKFLTVILDPNGGEVNPTSTSVVNGLTYRELPTPTRDGFAFEGWYTERDGGTKVEATTTVTSEINHTLYAHWDSNIAIFDTGRVVNGKMKGLANGSTTAIPYTNMNSTITTLTRSTTISDTYKNDEYKVSSSDSPKPIYMWFDEGTIYWYSDATTVYLNPNSSCMFYYLHGIISLDLNNLDTSKVTDMSEMFKSNFNYTTSLTSLNINSWNTSNVTNMKEMFSECKSLTTLDVSHFDTSKVTNMKEMFNECRSLTNLDVSHFDTFNVIDMSKMFYYCRNLTSLDVSNFNTSNVTNMKEMFYNLSNVDTLDVSNFDTSNVTNVTFMFGECRSITSLDVSHFDTSKVTNMAYMFYDCDNLENLDVSNFNTSNVTNMEGLFGYCKKLTSLDVSHFDTSKVTNMIAMFSECSNLTTLDLSNWDTSNLEKISNFSTSTIRSDGTYVSHVGSGMFSGMSSLVELKLGPNFNTSKVTNMAGLFDHNLDLTTLDLSTFDTSNVTNMLVMFYYCYNLKTIYVSDKWNTDKVTTSTSMFYLDTKLVGGKGTAFNSSKIDKEYARIDGGPTSSTPGYLTLSGQSEAIFDTGIRVNGKMKGLANGSTTSASYSNSNSTITAFTRSTTISDTYRTDAYKVSTSDSPLPIYMWFDSGTIYWYSDATNVYLNPDSSYMFYRFNSLTSLDLNNLDTSNVTNMRDMFSYCSKLASLDVSNFDTSNVTNMTEMFYYCSKLNSLDLSNFNTSNVTNMEKMFACSSGLTSINLTSLDTSKVSTMKQMFYYCSKLNSLDLSSFNTSNVTNMEEMFHLYDANAYVSSVYLLKTITFGENWDTSKVTTMKGMFQWDVGLTSLDVSNWNTSNVTNMYAIFDSCRNLTSLDVSNWNTSNVISMGGMFRGLNSLISLDVSHFDTSNVTYMGEMFSNCTKLTSLDVSHFDTSKVTAMEGMFANCEKLTSLDVSHFDTSNVTTMKRMFYYCDSLTSLDVSHFDTSKVTDMSGMFSCMRDLISLDLSSFDTSNVTVMGSEYTNESYTAMDGMFYNTRFQTIDLSSFDTSKVTKMGSMFRYNYNLKTIYVSDKWNTNNVTISAFMFKDTTNIHGGEGTTYNSSKVDKEYARVDGGPSSSTPGYLTLKVEATDAYFDTGMVVNGKMKGLANGSTTGASYTTSNTTITTFTRSTTLPSEYATETYDVSDPNQDSLPIYMWYDSGTIYWYSAATTVYLNEDSSYMFYYCYKLTSLDVSNFNTSNVTNMSNMFYDCYNLTSLDISNFNTSSVTNMRGMFAWCNKLTSLDVSNFNTSNVTDMSIMFSNCYNLTSLDISNFNTSNVTDMSIMFYSCSKLTSLDLTNFNTSKVTNMYRMFMDCNKLININLSSFDTSNVKNMAAMFAYCYDLISLDLTNFDTSNLEIISDAANFSYGSSGINSHSVGGMFEDCTSLTELKFGPNFNTSKVTNMNALFMANYKLTSLDLSTFDTSNVTTMIGMFDDCRKLKTIYIGSNWNTSNVIYSNYMFYNDATLVGGNGTTFNSSKINKEYARADGGPTSSTPGYLTLISEATFDTGMVVNGKMKALANGSTTAVSYTTDDTTIKAFTRSTTISDTYKTDAYKVSTSDSLTPIYMWYNSNTIYWYSDATTVYFNPDSSYMFYKLYRLPSLDLTVFNTSKVTNLKYMFMWCVDLASLDVSNWDTSNVTNMDTLFCHTSIKVLNVNNWNTSNVTNMSAMFNQTGVSSLDLSKWDVSNVTDMSSMFGGTAALTNLNISNWDTSNVTNMRGMFWGLSNMKNFNISHLNTSNVTDMTQLFLENENLESVDISNWDVSSVTTMEEMFKDCSSLKNIDVSSWNTSSLEKLGFMFFDTKIKVLDLSGWDTSKVTYMRSMFAGMSELTTIYVGTGWSNSKVGTTGSWYGEYVFSSATKLVGGAGTTYDANHIDKEYARVDGGTASPGYLTLKVTSTFDTGMVVNGKMKGLAKGSTMSASYSESNTNITTITRSTTISDTYKTDTYKVSTNDSQVPIYMWYDSGTIYWYSTATTVYLNPDCEFLFGDLRSLTSLNLSEFNTSKVTDMYAFFYHDNNLTNIDLSNFDTSKVTNMAAMFQYTPFTNLDLSSFNTSKVTTMDRMFAYASSLTNLSLNSFNTSSVKNMEGMFTNMYNLATLDISSFDTSNVTNMKYMFCNSGKLTTIYVGSNWNTNKVSSSDNMFTSSSKIVGGAGTTYDANHIDKEYAHIDGGTSNPGYLSDNSGDFFVNGKGFNIADANNSYDWSNAQDGSLMAYYYADGNKDGTTGDGLLILTGNGVPKSYTNTSLPSWSTNRLNIKSVAFVDCTPTSGSMAYLFYQHTYLTSVDISGLNSNKVTNIKGIFQDCQSLEELDLRTFDFSSITTRNDVIKGCNSLTHLMMPAYPTSNTKLGIIYFITVDGSTTNEEIKYQHLFDWNNNNKEYKVGWGCNKYNQVWELGADATYYDLHATPSS